MTQHAHPAALTFRAEVVDAHTNRWLGNIRLMQPMSSYLILACGLMLAAVLVLFLGLVTVSKKIPASGVLAQAERGEGGRVALSARLYVSAHHVGMLRPGLPVVLRFGALPVPRHVTQHGVIDQVSYVPAYSSSVDGTARPVPLYMVTVALPQQSVSEHGRTYALQPGMIVEATILRERRSLWRWMFEPVSAYLDSM